MKTVFVGGGAHRVIGICRGALGVPGLFAGGEICLHDLDVSRAELVGRAIMQTPEYAAADCRITWGNQLEPALEGADAVNVILMAGSRLSYALGNLASFQHGFLPSDNVSPDGAMLAVKGGRLLMGIAREMERRCPDAWLFDFANPVAVFSAMINNHTRIRALGVCEGYKNHYWDLPRLLGRDEVDYSIDVEAAGVNHLSFILRGTWDGEDVFSKLEGVLDKGWRPPKLSRRWSEITRQNVTTGLRKLHEIYRSLGALIFSTEFDGMWHLWYDEALAARRPAAEGLTPAKVKAQVRRGGAERMKADQALRELMSQEHPPSFWAKEAQGHPALMRQDFDVITRLLEGVGGKQPVKVVASYPNRGAVAGFKDRTALEYSLVMNRGKLKARGKYEIPESVHGLVAGLASHQTLLADAVATEDPRMLAQALLAYPVLPNSRAQRALYKQLLKINANEIPEDLRRAEEWL